MHGDSCNYTNAAWPDLFNLSPVSPGAKSARNGARKSFNTFFAFVSWAHYLCQCSDWIFAAMHPSLSRKLSLTLLLSQAFLLAITIYANIPVLGLNFKLSLTSPLLSACIVWATLL